MEFFTIPLYLSAQFSAPNKITKNLIREVVKDEMKHLFIVSNILNAVHDEKIYPGKAVPFDDPKFIPRYPSSPVGVFQAKNPKLKTFLTYDILPCVPEQMLKLLCIELPSETKNLHFDYLGHPTTGREDSVRKKRVQTLGRMIYDFTLEHE